MQVCPMTLPSGRNDGSWGKAWYVLGKEVSSLGIGGWGGVIRMIGCASRSSLAGTVSRIWSDQIYGG